MRKFDLSLRSSRSSYFATFRHQLTILSKTDALDEEKWLNMLGTFVKDWFRYESHFVHGRDSLVDILKERGLLSESSSDLVWFLLPRVARLMIHTPTAISIFVCLSMVQLMAVFISMRCTLCGHFLQVALTLILVVGYAIAAS